MPPLLNMNREVSALEGLKTKSCSLELNLEYHAPGACFNPYRALSSL